MRGLLLILLLCAAPAAAGETPCAGPKAEACGPGEVKLPFLKLLQESATAQTLTASSAEKARPAPPEGLEIKKTVSRRAAAESAPAAAARVELALFYTYDCPHCKKALAWLPSLKTAYPDLIVNAYEVKRDRKNRQLLARRLALAGAAPSGFPTFFAGEKLLVGFAEDRSPDEIKSALDAAYGKPGCPCEKKAIEVPLLGGINPASVSLLRFSFTLGLLDGLNPCAMWVLMFLMGLLVYTRSAKKMLLIGGIFVAASALVYFAFMAAWFNLFLIIGHAGWLTLALGLVAAGMGLINLKEIFFFKRGVSLMIADSAKTKVAEKIRRIMNEKEISVMVSATVLLAVFVNLIELGCTMGLPAIFTKVLAVKQSGAWQKYGYMAVYNAAYVIPLALIVSLFVCTMGRYKMTEAHGRALKGISGVLMFLLGVLMIVRPELLLRS